jgi:ATP-dependent Zn protease
MIKSIPLRKGGRAAEEIFFGATKSTTGATSDLEKATQLSYLMASRFGMTGSKFSMDEKHSALFSEAFKEDSYNLCNQILNDSYREVLEIIIKNKNIIHCIVYFLMKYETLYKIDLENIINGDYHLVGEAGSIQIKLPHLSPFDKSIMNF